MRFLIQPGICCGFTGQISTRTPALERVPTHLDFPMAFSHFPQETSSKMSGSAFSASSTRTCDPSRPGRPVGRRTSRMRREENSESAEESSLSLSQSKFFVTSCTVRSRYPFSCAAWMTWSLHSCTSNVSRIRRSGTQAPGTWRDGRQAGLPVRTFEFSLGAPERIPGG